MNGELILENLKKSVLYKFLYGVPILLIILVITAGFEGAFQLLFLSIVCTAGAGLGFWLLLAVITGWILQKILEAVYRDQINKLGASPILASDSLVQILRYIEDARNYGYNDGVIKTNLLQTGWKSDEIEVAFKKYKKK